MAENVLITPGSGDTVAADDIGSVKFQRVKVTLGADGVSDGDVAAGNPLPADIVVALPAGTNNIGDVDVLTLPTLPAGTNNIGDVDVLSVIPGTGATNLGKAEDATHTSGDTGVMALGVYQTARTQTAGTAGDYSPLSTDAQGDLYARVVPDRPSQGMGRVYKTGQVDVVTADTQVYDVTAGKTLYITSWGLSFHNSSTIATGHVRLRDGDATGAIIVSWALPPAIAGLTAPHAALGAQMQEPKQFTDAVFIDVVTGALAVSFQFTGYES